MNVSYLLIDASGAELMMLGIFSVGLGKFYENLHEVMTLDLNLRI